LYLAAFWGVDKNEMHVSILGGEPPKIKLTTGSGNLIAFQVWQSAEKKIHDRALKKKHTNKEHFSGIRNLCDLF
jgi:hypothetical protein